ncbi:MAG: hypothetical protein IPH57_07220 [Saprospiraceae bacterium]|nr:hypothetical protein [Saprospiraceae bacterium]
MKTILNFILLLFFSNIMLSQEDYQLSDIQKAEVLSYLDFWEIEMNQNEQFDVGINVKSEQLITGIDNIWTIEANIVVYAVTIDSAKIVNENISAVPVNPFPDGNQTFIGFLSFLQGNNMLYKPQTVKTESQTRTKLFKRSICIIRDCKGSGNSKSMAVNSLISNIDSESIIYSE